MKSLIIAEKPSVATDIAKALGKMKKVGDYHENDEFIVSSAIGHLVTLFMPEDFDKKLRYWTLEALPIIPKEFQLKPIKDSEDRFQLLEKLIHRKDVGEIINACDAGREGELIFRYIVQLAQAKKPVKRLWLSSMTQQAIRDGFRRLRDGRELDPLGAAAMCRSESDWLVGINGTRAFTRRLYGSKSKQLATVGRVQTPTLAMLCDRESAIRAFQSTDYWEVFGDFSIGAGGYVGRWFDPSVKVEKSDDKDSPEPVLRPERIWDAARAEAIRTKCLGKPGRVEEETKPSTQAPPALFDLTSLQREANQRFGYSASRTLQVAQRLYEGRKMVTYPRTDSRCLPEDYIPTVQATLDALKTKSAMLGPFAGTILNNQWVRPNKRIFNNAKVSDHFAIIPTGEFTTALSPDEERVFELIAKRFLAIFFPVARFEVTTRITTVEEERFKTEGKILVDPGWLAVYGREEQGDDHAVPALKSGETAATEDVRVEALHTRPPARYTEATLLTAMETAGKRLEDEDLREAMKERGLGTPATRASIIEQLIRELYVTREGKELIPTAKGMAMIDLLRRIHIESLISPATTGEWEHKLRLMERQELTRDQFMQEITDLTRSIVHKAKTFEDSDMESKPFPGKSPIDGSDMIETYKAYQSVKGDFVIYKIISGRKIEPEEAVELIEKRVVGPLRGFISAKTKKEFPAFLKLDEEWKVKIFFDNSPVGADGQKLDISTMEPLAQCPVCKGSVYEAVGSYFCENTTHEEPTCKFKVSKQILKRDIDRTQFLKLIRDRKTDLLDKFWSPRTRRPFSAYLKLEDTGKVSFEFEPRPPREPGAKGKKGAKGRGRALAGAKKGGDGSEEGGASEG